MSNLYRRQFIDAFYHVSFHLTKRLQRRFFFRNRPIRNKNCLWWPCLLTNRDEMSHCHKGPSIDASYQVLTNQKEELPVAAMFDNVSELNQQSLYRIFQGCFLPSFSSFGQVVSEQIFFFRNLPIRNNCLWPPCLFSDRDEMRNLYRGSTSHRCFLPSFGSFGQAVSEKIFKFGQSETRIAYGSHVCLRIGTKLAIFIEYLPYMFWFIWQSGYREDSQKSTNQKQVSVHLAKRFQRRRFLEIDQSETRIVCGGHVCQWIGTKLAIFTEELPQMLPTKFWFIWPNGFRGEEF